MQAGGGYVLAVQLSWILVAMYISLVGCEGLLAPLIGLKGHTPPLQSNQKERLVPHSVTENMHELHVCLGWIGL